MNNRCITTLLCTMVLAFAPACNKRKPKAIQHDVKKMIELDSPVFEIEEIDADNDQKSIAKF